MAEPTDGSPIRTEGAARRRLGLGERRLRRVRPARVAGVAGLAAALILGIAVSGSIPGPPGGWEWSWAAPAERRDEKQDPVAVPAELLGLPPVSSDSLPQDAHEESEPLGLLSDLVRATDGEFRVDYAMDEELTRRVFRVMDRGRVKQGHVIVLDPATGRVIVYASSDLELFPPTRAYPAASLIKIVTAAAAIDRAPEDARRPCVFRGNPYRLTRARIHTPSSGREVSLEHALASSNNQCFAQLAVNQVGSEALIRAIGRFGLLESPAPGHAAGSIERGEDDYDLGRLGCGLAGCRITPMHAARLAAALASGELVTPWWIERVVDARGQELSLPARPSPRRVMSAELAEELRSMLVRTTRRGTARSAFHERGRPRLGSVAVAGKTGNLTGSDPKGRYEWFAAVAPADKPTVAIAVLQLQGHLWWRSSPQIAADVLVEIFCESGRCSPDNASRYTGALGGMVAPVALSDRDPFSPD